MPGDGPAVDLYVPLTELPTINPKFGLTKPQQYWFKHFGKMLIATGKLCEAYLVHLYSLSKSMDYLLQAEKAIDEAGYTGGIVSKTPNGYYQISAHVVAREKSLKQINDFSKLFGLSFYDVNKVKPQKDVDPAQGDLFNAFKNRNAK